MKKTKIGIIGYGKLGSNLLGPIIEKHELLWVHPKKSKSEVSEKQFGLLASISIPELIIISVNDSEIESAAKTLSKILGNDLKNVWVVHCSGVLPVSILSSCEKKGAKTACIHPYQTFYYKDDSALKGIGWTIETKNNPSFLQSFIKSLGGNPYVITGISKNKKVFHHLSAVFASNFLITVLSGAGSLEESAGMKWGNFIPPIVETTKNNVYESLKNSGEIPLTGPIARADSETVKLHLKSLKNNKYLLNTYIYLSLATLETAKAYKIISKQKFAEIKEILLVSLKD
ncbi:MAG: DUF2520 domain-containing protein [Ignavibacteriae bacterium]|nr:DUF2520 domain-containing protein [Ignavibacteriota bacterium]